MEYFIWKGKFWVAFMYLQLRFEMHGTGPHDLMPRPLNLDWRWAADQSAFGAVMRPGD